MGKATGCLGLAHPCGRDQAHFGRFFISGPLGRFFVPTDFGSYKALRVENGDPKGASSVKMAQPIPECVLILTNRGRFFMMCLSIFH